MPKAYLPILYPLFIKRFCVWLLLRYRKRNYGFAFRLIPLTQGQFAVVDPQDFDQLNEFKWHAKKHRNTSYAVRSVSQNGINININMHRLILNAPVGSIVDHKNRNGLDNRKENLRFATPAQNAANRAKVRGLGSSIYKGVKRDGARWRADITHNCLHEHLGSFVNEIDAAKAYDEAAKKFHGEFAVLNFPQVAAKTDGEFAVLNFP